MTRSDLILAGPAIGLALALQAKPKPPPSGQKRLHKLRPPPRRRRVPEAVLNAA